MRRFVLFFLLAVFPSQLFAVTPFVEQARARKAQSALLLRARAEAEKGAFAASLDQYERALRLFISPKILVEVGGVFEKKGDAVGARDAYQAFLALSSSSDPARAEVEAALGRLGAGEGELPGRFSRLVGAGRMVAVSAGDFLMGLNGYDEVERPQRTVTLSGFSIDIFEVTNQEYSRCVDDGVCQESALADDPETSSPRLPVVGVSWADAATFCAWAKKRLPTEAEWEKAARGTDGRLFPWGNEPDCEKGNFGAVGGADYGCLGKNPGRVVAVGSYPKGASFYGVLDMAGNVQEWVGDWYLGDYYDTAPTKDPPGPAQGEYRVVRGGNYGSSPPLVEVTDRKLAVPETYGSSLGFRCVKPDDPSFVPEMPSSQPGDVEPTPPL